MISFNDIKNDPSFRTSNKTLEQQLEKCKDRMNYYGFHMVEKVMELVKEYGNFYIDRFEHESGDRLRFYFEPLFNPTKYWSEFDQYAVFIGSIINSDCKYYNGDPSPIESAYLLNDGCYYNQSKKKIADSIEELFDYFMKVEYDYHAPISQKTYDSLKKCGWYEGRKVDISGLIEECEENGITLTDKQKSFFEEFSGISNRSYDGSEPDMFILSEGIFQDIDDFEKKWIYDHYDENAVFVGYCYLEEGTIWLTSDGQMLLTNISGMLNDENWVSPIGRTIMNGFNVILG